MRKVFTFLLTAIVCMASHAPACATETLQETSPTINVPASNSPIEGTSYTINGTYNAGASATKIGTTPTVKFRVNRSAGSIANAIEFSVNDGYEITGISFQGVTNTDDVSATIGNVYVDGIAHGNIADKNMPARNSGKVWNMSVNNIHARESIVLAFSELNGVTQANICYSIEYRQILALNLTKKGLTIDDWTVTGATLNETNSSAGKYTYDIAGGVSSISYVTATPNVEFQISNSNDKANAFYIYPGKCYEFNGKNGVLRVKETEADDTIRITVAAKGSTVANFADGTGTYPKNATALTADLTLPAKGSEGADANGYVWRTLEYVSKGGDVEIAETAAGFRARLVEIVPAKAPEPPATVSDSGTFGTNNCLSWTLMTDGVLIIRGNGATDISGYTPWNDSELTQVIIEADSVTLYENSFPENVPIVIGENVNYIKFN